MKKEIKTGKAICPECGKALVEAIAKRVPACTFFVCDNSELVQANVKCGSIVLLKDMKGRK